jgi:hypothetical protein
MRLCDARIAADQVDPGLDVLGYAKVVQRHRQQNRVGGEQFVDERGGKLHCGLLLRGACLRRRGRGGDRESPGVRGQHIDADVAPLDRGTGVSRKPLLLDNVRDLAAGRTVDADAGIQTK